MLFCGFCWVPLVGQNPFSNPRLINQDAGLPDNRINAIAFDWEGFLWVATDNGLCRFDGTQTRPFFHDEETPQTLTDNRVYNLAVDSVRHRIWVGTRFGLNCYDPLTETFTRFFFDPQDSTSLPDNWVWNLQLDKEGRVWMAAGRIGLYCYDPEQKYFFHHPLHLGESRYSAPFLKGLQGVNDILFDPRDPDVLWLATNSGLVKYNHNRRLVLDILSSKTPDKQLSIQQVYIHDDGIIYLRSTTDGLLKYDPAQKTYSQIQLAESLPESRSHFLNLVRKSETQIWVTTRRGAAILNSQTGKTERYFFNERKNKRHFGVDILDPKGRIWARSSYGLHMFDPQDQKVANYYYRENVPFESNATTAILEDPRNGKLYLAPQTGKGLYVLNRNTEEWTMIPPPQEYLLEDSLFHGNDLLFTQDSQVLILTMRGLYQLSSDGKRMLAYPHQPPSNKNSYFVHLIEDYRGIIWICTINDGLIRLDPKTETYSVILDALRTEVDPMHFRWFFSPFEDRENKIWFRARTGISVMDPSTETFTHVPYDPQNPVIPEGVWGIEQDLEGTIWVVGSQLEALDPDKPEEGVFNKVPFPKGYPGTMTLKKDQKGHIWTVSYSGLYRFDPITQEIDFLGSKHGLAATDDKFQTSALVGNVLTLLSSGEIAVGYLRGLGIFHPDSLEKSQELPRPYLSSFMVLGKEQTVDSSLQYKKHISLAYNQNFFSFEFSTIAYSQSGRQTFAYMLEGIDPDWVQAGSRDYASYTHVPGGDYTFLLKAFNREGESIEEPYRLQVHVDIPWWQTLWFQVVLTALILGLVYAGYRYRIYQIRREAQLRSSFERKLADVEMSALRAQMNPHFIFNCLNSIDYYIWKNDPEMASEYLNSFSRLIRLILQNSRSEFISLKDELEALRLYVEMEGLRFENQFSYTIYIDPEIDPAQTDLPPMLLQPYVENAIWHGLMPKSEAGELKVNISKNSHHLICLIEDNGIGREAAAALSSRHKTRKKSMGLRITQDRLSLINRLYQTDASVEIIDLTNDKGEATGTRVELKIPL